MPTHQEWRIAADLYARGPHSEFQGPAAGPPPPSLLPHDPSTTPPDQPPDAIHNEHQPNGSDDQEGDTAPTGHRALGGSGSDGGGGGGGGGGELPPQDGYFAGTHWRLNGDSGDGACGISTMVPTSVNAPGALPAISRPRPAAHSVPATTAGGAASASQAQAASIRVRARPGLSTPAANWQHLGEVPDLAEDQEQGQGQSREGKVRLPSMAPPTPPLGQASAEPRPGTSLGARVSGIARRLGSLGSLITRLPMPMRRPQLPPMGRVLGLGGDDVPEVPETALQGAGAVQGGAGAPGGVHGVQGGRVGGGGGEGRGVGGAVEVEGQWGVGRAGSGRADMGRAGSSSNGKSVPGSAAVAVRSKGSGGGVSVRAAASVDGGPEEGNAAAEREFVGQGFVRRNTRPDAGDDDGGAGGGGRASSGGGGSGGLAMSRRQRGPLGGKAQDGEGEGEEGPEDVSSPMGAWGGGNGMTAGAVSRGRKGNRGHGEEEEEEVGGEQPQPQERGMAGGMWASKGRGLRDEGSNAVTSGAGGQGTTRDARNASAPVAMVVGYGGYNGMTAGATQAGSRKQYDDGDQEDEYTSRMNVRTRKMQSADAGPLAMTSGADRYGSRARRDDDDDDRLEKVITNGKKDDPYMSVNPTYGTLMTAGADRRRRSSDEEDAAVTVPIAVPLRPPAASKPKKAQPRQSTLMAMAFNPFAVQRDSVLMTKGEGALLDPSFQKDLAQRAGMAEARAAVSRRGTRQGSRADAGPGDVGGEEMGEVRYGGRPAGPVAEGEEGTHGSDAALLGGSTPARRLALPPLPPLAGLAPLPPLVPVSSAGPAAATGAAVLVGTAGAGGGSGSSAVAAVADDSPLLRQATSRALIHGVRTGSGLGGSSRGSMAASAKLSRQGSGARSGSLAAAAAAAAATLAADIVGGAGAAAAGGSPANQGSTPAADGVTHGSPEGRPDRPIGRRPGVGRYGLWGKYDSKVNVFPDACHV